MSPRPYEAVSCDTHLELSPVLLEQWRSHFENDLHEFLPKIVKLDTGDDGWLPCGESNPMPPP